MVCAGLLTTTKISGTTAFRGCAIVAAELGFWVAKFELLGAPCDSDWVSAFGDTVLGVPANHKWFRNLAVSQIIADTMDEMGLQLPATQVDIAEMRRKYHAAEREEKAGGLCPA
jgi:hypothetical protein